MLGKATTKSLINSNIISIQSEYHEDSQENEQLFVACEKSCYFVVYESQLDLIKIFAMWYARKLFYERA